MAWVPIWTLMPVITIVLLLLVTSRVKPPGYRGRTGAAFKRQEGPGGSASPPASSRGGGFLASAEPLPGPTLVLATYMPVELRRCLICWAL